MAGIIILIIQINKTLNKTPSSLLVLFNKIRLRVVPFTPKSIKGTEGTKVWITNIVLTAENKIGNDKSTPKKYKINTY